MDIIHLDMDAFYASVEVLDNPALRGRPVIVGGGFERGVVSAASYEARKFGVHSAMAMALARRRCPDGIFLPVRMARYCEISQTIHAIFHRFTPLVEPLSLDEAFLDVTGSTALFGTPPEIARRIKELVREETGLTVSAGVASCKLVAKIASDLEKPDGLTVVPPGSEQQFLAGLTIERLWGVGKCTCKELQMMGVRTMGDLTRLPEKLLTAKFGRHGPLLHQAALGIDHRRVEPFRPAQSVGNEETFSVDLISPAVIRQELLALAVKVGRRLRGDGLQGRTVTVKIKYHDFAQITRSATLAETTDDHRTIHQACCRLLEKSEAGMRPIRLLGITVSNLAASDRPRQQPLFATRETERRPKLNRALDAIADKFGNNTILPAALLPPATSGDKKRQETAGNAKPAREGE